MLESTIKERNVDDPGNNSNIEKRRRELPFFEENFSRRKMKSKNFGAFKVRLG